VRWRDSICVIARAGRPDFDWGSDGRHRLSDSSGALGSGFSMSGGILPDARSPCECLRNGLDVAKPLAGRESHRIAAPSEVDRVGTDIAARRKRGYEYIGMARRGSVRSDVGNPPGSALSACIAAAEAAGRASADEDLSVAPVASGDGDARGTASTGLACR
jgi:hypothetical protein